MRQSDGVTHSNHLPLINNGPGFVVLSEYPRIRQQVSKQFPTIGLSRKAVCGMLEEGTKQSDMPG